MTFSPKSTPSMSRYGASLTGPSAKPEEGGDCLHDRPDLSFLHPGKDRQRKGFLCQRLGNGEASSRVAEVRVGGGEVRRIRIVNACADAAVSEKLGELVPSRSADDVEVPHGLTPRGNRWCPQLRHLGESGRVRVGNGAPLVVPAVQQRKLP